MYVIIFAVLSAVYFIRLRMAHKSLLKASDLLDVTLKELGVDSPQHPRSRSLRESISLTILCESMCKRMDYALDAHKMRNTERRERTIGTTESQIAADAATAISQP